jgi:hypothetical protein
VKGEQEVSSSQDFLFKLKYFLTVAKNSKFDFMKTYYSVALVRKRTIPTERPPLVGEVSVKFNG